MNRIYQGKVTGVEIHVPGDKQNPWQPLDQAKWQAALWQHHELFQDAVNYYTLALAAMAADVEGDTPAANALRGWVGKVRETWASARRKAAVFAGPRMRIAAILKLAPEECGFENAAHCVLRSSRATPSQRAAAMLRLLEEADRGDLNKVCGERIAFLCPANPQEKKRPTSKAVSSVQEVKRQQEVRRFHQMPEAQALKEAPQLNLGLFLTQPPTELLEEAEAATELRAKFSKAAAKFADLNAIASDFEKHLAEHKAALKVPTPGRKPSGLYPFAAIFKFYPCTLSLRAFLQATKTLAEAKDKAVVGDAIAEARIGDQAHFDYFTNVAFVRESEDDRATRAVWFEFDLAAFVEAIKAPHRYFQDSLTRERSAEALRQRKQAIEGRGRETDDDHEEDDPGSTASGFEGDERIKLLRELVTDTLGYVAEAEDPGAQTEHIEYTVQERTLRGFEEVKERWRKLAGKGEATPEKLLGVLADQQAKHRDDFGSATLYRTLAQPRYHPIWRDAGTEKWHAPDPLKAWRAYKEVCFELEHKERPIRFTPAQAEHSPRYFIMPKQGRLGSDHQPGQLAFTCGVVLSGIRGLEPRKVRITYSAPRLRRDELRRDGHEDLEAAPWLQPMMKALELPEVDTQDFANCRVTLQPEAPDDIQLTFPVEIKAGAIDRMLGCRTRWDFRVSGKNRQMNFAQFNYSASEPRAETTLRWPCDIEFAKAAGAPRKSEPVHWHEKLDRFCCLATDLGQRDAGAFARLAASCDASRADFGTKPSRFIGEPSTKSWRAVLERSGLFRLPGEDAEVWRAISSRDREDPEDSGAPFDFREELWGEHGRSARQWEADETAELMRQFEVPPEDEDLTLLPEQWREQLSFPEQNDKLLVAMRRYQSRIARLHRWCWFLGGDDKRASTAWDEIGECEDARLISAEQRAAALKRDPRLRAELELQLRARLQAAPGLLERIANRILPLRGRSWRWELHPQATQQNPLHQLTQSGPSLDSKLRPVWLRGQRGLSLERIEQVEELRRRVQSLNQALRRAIGGKPPTRRDEALPDPCPGLLDKLDHLKEQRVNQTAHLILAEALGLRLAPPPANKKQLRQDRDQHGLYEKMLNSKGVWIGPADFVIIEDLSRYRATQGRAPRENSRLMKWCHRAVRDKLKQLCEVFGLPVLETPAAYSSRFCSRSGVPGFRAEEVTVGFTRRGHWGWLASRKDTEGRPTAEAEQLQEVERQLSQAQQELERDWAESKRTGRCPKRALLVPMSGGPLFVPVVEQSEGAEIQPAVVQADVNAAINLALRAIADPRLWSIHPRLRTQRNKEDHSLAAREKRKFGEKNPPKLALIQGEKPISDGATNPNFFADLAGLAAVAKQLANGHHDLAWLTNEWTQATLPGAESVRLLHSKTFWGTVKAAQWKRIRDLNSARLGAWRAKLDRMPA